jgi:hypothetical protein
MRELKLDVVGSIALFVAAGPTVDRSPRSEATPLVAVRPA